VHYGFVPPWRPLLALFSRLERVMLRRSEHVFVSNDGLLRMLGPLVDEGRMSVVFDYVDLDIFDQSRIDQTVLSALRRRFKPEGERLVAYIGMFKNYQGVDYLIRAFAAVAERFPGTRLLLVGDGPCRADYEALIAELGIADRVLMPGLVPHRAVATYLAVADVLVSPRIDNDITQGGFVSQMPEYMAAGKAIVATEVSGCVYLLRDGAGILVEPNDDAALAAGIERALTLSPEGLAEQVQAARANVTQFTWQHGILDVQRVMEGLVGGGGAPSEPRPAEVRVGV
jgi:glycosyltransferase involved in cell wall biosynthesis